jgi:hypothetical protein
MCGRLGQSLGGCFDAFTQLVGVQPADRMLDHDQPRFDLARLGLRQHERLERLSGDHVGRDAALLEFDAVVETPR